MGPSKPVLDQQRQIAAVIEMGVGEDHRLNVARVDGKRRPVLEAQRLEALKQAAVDQELAAVFSSAYFEPVTVPAPPRNVRLKGTMASIPPCGLARR